MTIMRSLDLGQIQSYIKQGLNLSDIGS
jgi:hypothetical protein